MILHPKVRESRSPPGPLNPRHTTPRHTHAGWSSPVARQAHNLKVTGSNPVPATQPNIPQSDGVGGYVGLAKPRLANLSYASIRAERLRELEVGGMTSAAHSEGSSDRLTQCHGYRDRDWETRAGTVQLRIPKLRRILWGKASKQPRRCGSGCGTVRHYSRHYTVTTASNVLANI